MDAFRHSCQNTSRSNRNTDEFDDENDKYKISLKASVIVFFFCYCRSIRKIFYILAMLYYIFYILYVYIIYDKSHIYKYLHLFIDANFLSPIIDYLIVLSSME